MKYLIIWDWDNTLADTREAVKAGLQEVVTHFNLPPLTDEDVHNVMTHHRGEFWERNFGPRLMEGIMYYLQQYPFHNDAVKLFPKARDILAYLYEKGILQVILSNKKHETLLAECDRLDVTKYLTRVVGSDEINGAKPEKGFAQHALKGLSYDKIILIGDGESDMLMARNLGAEAVWLKQDTQAKNLPYTVLVHSLAEVFAYLKKEVQPA